MRYRKLGNSDVMVSELAFGAWAIGGWLWGGADSGDAIKDVDFSLTNDEISKINGYISSLKLETRI